MTRMAPLLRWRKRGNVSAPSPPTFYYRRGTFRDRLHCSSMQAQHIEFLQLFNGPVQYVVPRWQRRYRWGQSDIERLVEDLLTVASAGPDAAHYGGTLLTFPEPGVPSGVVKPIRVVDGQQRLTTVSHPPGQLGPEVVALVVELHTHLGVPLAKVAHLLRTRFGLSVTPGGLAQVLHRAARDAAPTYTALCEQIRDAPVVTPDETGWRVGAVLRGEDGIVPERPLERFL